jgi:NADH:quinone reductase (non-electrogenic)
MTESKGPHIVVLGAGFGGLTFCQTFRHPEARVTLVDRANHHLFQPLLYQVATAGLSPAEIAQPTRAILSSKSAVTVLLDRVIDFKLAEKKVILEKGALAYDYLVLGLGGVTSYFGHPEWERFAPGLKSLEDATRIRREVLLAFEKAESESDSAVQDRLMTIVVVGGGPTGVELAGAFAELARVVLRRDFRRIDPGRARIILLEAGPRILSHLPEDLSESAQRQLTSLGVQVRAATRVKAIREHEVEVEPAASAPNAGPSEMIWAENVIWAAGVAANPLTRKLGVELDRAGRVKVNPDLSLPAHPEVFAIGDMALVLQQDGKPVPGISPAAMQMGVHVARLLEDELESPGTAHRAPFRYWDKGTMATIGRSAAVALIGPVRLHGLIAWLAWLFVHLIFLVGFRNKLAVLLQWAYSYFAYKRGARLITNLPTEGAPAPPGAS